MDPHEPRYLGLPYKRPPGTVYDYTDCADDAELKCAIREINHRGYSLISVTQDPHGRYKVFFMRNSR